MTEQRSTGSWFQAARIPDDELGRTLPVSTWKRCPHEHATEERARACAEGLGPTWTAVRATRVEEKLEERHG